MSSPLVITTVPPGTFPPGTFVPPGTLVATQPTLSFPTTPIPRPVSSTPVYRRTSPGIKPLDLPLERPPRRVIPRREVETEEITYSTGSPTVQQTVTHKVITPAPIIETKVRTVEEEPEEIVRSPSEIEIEAIEPFDEPLSLEDLEDIVLIGKFERIYDLFERHNFNRRRILEDLRKKRRGRSTEIRIY